MNFLVEGLLYLQNLSEHHATLKPRTLLRRFKSKRSPKKLQIVSTLVGYSRQLLPFCPRNRAEGL
mgnify:CR=1 FL=1